MTKSATIVIALLLLSTACEQDPQPENELRSIQPATVFQIDQIKGLLEEDVRIRSLHRAPSGEHEDHWYVAGWVYGPNVVDNVAVWLVSDVPNKGTQVLAVDTMADACSYATYETDSTVSWEDNEVQRLETYVTSRQ